MTDRQRILFEIEKKYEEWKLGNSAEAKYRREAYKELIELIKPIQEEPANEFLDTESMIESYKQRLISQVNGMKDSIYVKMCLASYKHGINEILDALNLSDIQRTANNWKEPQSKEFISNKVQKAIDATIGYWNHTGLSIDVKLPKDLKEGSKCKILIIKDE